MSDELPEGWTLVPLEELLMPGGLFDGPFGSSLKTADYVPAGVRVIRLENLGHLTFEGSKWTFISKGKYETLKKHRVCEGDIIFGSFVGDDVRVCVLPPLDTPAIAKADCFCIRTNETVADRRFLAYYLATPEVRDGLIDHIHGATRPRINTGQLRRFDVRLAPAAEQLRLVKHVAALLAKVRTSQERLDKIPSILKRFRQAVVAAACTGRLTTNWRQDHQGTSSGSDVAREIDDVRARAARAKAGRQRNVAGDDYLRVEVLQEGEWPDEDIPDGWTWVRFGSVIGELRNGVSPRPNLDPPGTPMLRISAARPGTVDLSDARYLPNSKELLPTFALQDGDLLFTRYNGSIELLGVCGMVRGLGQRALLYPDKLMRVRFDHDFVLPRFAELFFQNGAVHDRVVAKSKSSAGQNGISGSDVKSQPFALLSLPEQREIVRRVESLFSLADRLEARYEKAKAQVDRLEQAALAKAFRGELVPTEAELAKAEGRPYETAEQLLARIQGTQAAATDSSPSTRPPARKKRAPA